MDLPDTGFAQRLAFAVAASLLVHAMALPELAGGTINFKRLTGSGLPPIQVSMRTVLRELPEIEATQSAHSRRDQTEIASARLASSLAGVAPTAPRLPSTLPNADLSAIVAAEAAPTTRTVGDLKDALSVWPDESGFGPYRPVTEVDVRPIPLTQIEPKYPDNITNQVSGRVLLLVLIGRDGLVDQVRVLSSEPAQEFGLNAKSAFEQARFTPAQVQGQPAPTYLTIEVNFG